MVFALQGLTEGFHLVYLSQPLRLHSSYRNNPSPLANSWVVSHYIQEEVVDGHITSQLQVAIQDTSIVVQLDLFPRVEALHSGEQMFICLIHVRDCNLPLLDEILLSRRCGAFQCQAWPWHPACKD